MQDKRPVYLSVNPLKFTFPIAALASIVHRITGALLFIAVAYLLYLLQLALQSPAGFAEVRALLDTPLHQLGMFATLGALAYHFVLGVKHLLLDFHLLDSLEGSRYATLVSLVLFAVLLILIAVWIWV